MVMRLGDAAPVEVWRTWKRLDVWLPARGGSGWACRLIEGLGVPVLFVNVGEGGPLGCGASRNVREDIGLHH